MNVLDIFNIIDKVLLILFILFSFSNLFSWVDRCSNEHSLISITNPKISIAYLISLFLIVPDYILFSIVNKNNTELWLHIYIVIFIYLTVGFLVGVKNIMIMSKYNKYLVIKDYNKQERLLFIKSMVIWPILFNKTVGQIIKKT